VDGKKNVRKRLLSGKGPNLTNKKKKTYNIKKKNAGVKSASKKKSLSIYEEKEL